MSLEDEIHQKGFNNEYQKAILNLMYTTSHLQNCMNVVFKKFDITRQQYNVLRILRGQHPGHASVNLIRDRMIDRMSDASRIVERLRLKDLVERKNAEKDKRAVEVTITQKGLDLLTSMQSTIDSFDLFLHNLTEEETRLLNTLLDKCRQSEFSEATVQALEGKKNLVL